MILKTKPIKSLLLETKEPFIDIKEHNRNYNSCYVRKIMFHRYIGIPNIEDDYIKSIKELDTFLYESNVPYIKCQDNLKKLFFPKEVDEMQKVWSRYIEYEQKGINPHDLLKLDMGHTFNDDILEWTKKMAFKSVLELYSKDNIINTTIKKNFVIKILLWINNYLPKLFHENNNSVTPKFIYIGDIKKNELYFLIFLFRIGCDILYINPKGDVTNMLPYISKLSNATIYDKKSNLSIELPKHRSISHNCDIKSNNSKTIRVVTKEKEKVNNVQVSTPLKPIKSTTESEKSYEEIAKLAEAVVMIKVYDKLGKLKGGGSGVLIRDDGYIITNFHVVSKGVAYGVLFENDANEYKTYKLIKYHTNYDLALIKVNRHTKAIPCSKDSNLIRGQKIVTIGSPLGLFNTVSDGIISGFRSFDNLNMIQITAPISSGSSGGALLNMKGELIGITSAGFDEGQNLNLAVPIKYIKQFISNFI